METEPTPNRPWTKSEVLGVILIIVSIVIGLGLTWFGPKT